MRFYSLLFLFSIVNLVQLKAQKPKLKPNQIIVKNAQIQSLDDHIAADAEKTKLNIDSAQLITQLSTKLCQYFEEGFKNNTVSADNFVSLGFSAITQVSEDTITYLEHKTCPTCPEKSAESLSSAFGLILKKVMKECPTMNDILHFDGKQRPAYAHLTTQVCRCLGDKIATFKDRDLAMLKFRYINDSCLAEVFADEKNREIVFKANDFQTKGQVDSFDLNFRPYAYLNCDIFIEGTMNNFKVWVNNMLKNTQQATSNYSINDKRNDKIQPILYQVTRTLGYPNSQIPIEDNFISTPYYKASMSNINNAKSLFANFNNLDYMQDVVLRSDNITEIRLTVYHFLAKTKKRTIKGILIFEFENDNEKISSFRYMSQSQIPNYEALQAKINNF